MILHGLIVRYLLDLFTSFLGKLVHNNNPLTNFSCFWNGIQERYYGFHARNIDGDWIQHLIGNKINPSTSQQDLWTAMVDTLLLFDDPSMSIICDEVVVYSRNSVNLSQYTDNAIHCIRNHYLLDRGGRTANNFVYGVLHAHNSPGWRFGYMAINSMEGFIEVPKFDSITLSLSPAKGSLSPLSKSHLNTKLTRGCKRQTNFAVPEVYDSESMRWAMESILSSMESLNGLILDLRMNEGGGSLDTALILSSYFSPGKTKAFAIAERNTSNKSVVVRKHVMNKKCEFRHCYTGPLVILQSSFTSGSAEVLSMALQPRPNTCRVGSRSKGSLSQVSQYTLPNGWKVKVPSQRVLNFEGIDYEGLGIPVESCTDPRVHDICDTTDACLKAAVDILMKSKSIE